MFSCRPLVAGLTSSSSYCIIVAFVLERAETIYVSMLVKIYKRMRADGQFLAFLLNSVNSLAFKIIEQYYSCLLIYMCFVCFQT